MSNTRYIMRDQSRNSVQQIMRAVPGRQPGRLGRVLLERLTRRRVRPIPALAFG